MSFLNRPPLLNLLVALAAALACFSYAAHQVEAAAAVESGFLALLVCALLLPLAALAPPPAIELGLGAVLATLLIWVVPAGPTRGAALLALLTLALTVALLRRLGQRAEPLSWPILVPLALALQLLVRGHRLLAAELDLQLLIGLFAFPLAVAAAAAALVEEGREKPLLIAFGTAFLLTPGWSTVVTLSLLALAAASLARRSDLSPWLRGAPALAVVLVAMAWEPPLAAVLTVAVAIYALAPTPQLVSAVIVACALLGLLLPAVRGWGEALTALALLPLLLPALARPSRHRFPTVLMGLVLALITLRTVPGLGSLAAPLALIALGIDHRRASGSLQQVWTGGLVFGSALLAAYPWLRHQPLEDLLRLLSLRAGWRAALILVVAVTALDLLNGWWNTRHPRLAWRPRDAGLIAVFIALLLGLPPHSVKPFGDPARVLDAGNSEISIELDGATRVASVILDSYLTNAADLAAGTPVADVRLYSPDGRLHLWQVRAGVDTAEWAARRSDVKSLPGFIAPPHWLAWVAPSGEIFAQRYRARWRPEEPFEAVRLEVVRSSDLALQVSMAVFHLELRP